MLAGRPTVGVVRAPGAGLSGFGSFGPLALDIPAQAALFVVANARAGRGCQTPSSSPGPAAFGPACRSGPIGWTSGPAPSWRGVCAPAFAHRARSGGPGRAAGGAACSGARRG